MKPVYQYPEEARQTLNLAEQQQRAIMSSADPALRSIETQYGMAPGANVLRANVIPTDVNPQRNYMEAMRSLLPQYVNSKRDYQAFLEAEAEKKRKASGSGSGGSGMGLFPSGTIPPGYGSALPDPADYLPATRTLAQMIMDNKRTLSSGNRPSQSRMTAAF